jgi:hypothetical protein
MQLASSKTLTGYCAYLVRLWQDSPTSAWRAAARSVQTGETVRFTDLEQLFAFLRAQTVGQIADHEQAPPLAGSGQERRSE